MNFRFCTIAVVLGVSVLAGMALPGAAYDADAASNSAAAAATERELAGQSAAGARLAANQAAAQTFQPRAARRAARTPAFKRPEVCSRPGVYVVSARTGSPFDNEPVVKNSTVCIVDLNPVRFAYSVNQKVTAVADAVDLTNLPFIPKLPSAGSATTTPKNQQEQAANKAAPAAAEPNAGPITEARPQKTPLENEFHALADKVDLLGSGESGDELTPLKRSVSDLIEFTERAKFEVGAFQIDPNDSNRDVAVSGMVRMLNEYIYPLSDGAWPVLEQRDLQDKVGDLRSKLETLPTRYPALWSAWTNEDDHVRSYSSALDRVKAVQTFLNSLDDSRKTWSEVRNSLMAVGVHFDNVLASGDDPFTIVVVQTCGIMGKKTEITLHVVDLTKPAGGSPAKSQADGNATTAQPATATDVKLVTIECSSPLSLSAGIALSTIDERDYALVAPPSPAGSSSGSGGSGSSGNVLISLKGQSRFHPVPVMLLNVRLWSSSAQRIGLHYSFGAGVDLAKGTLGNDWEFLTGPSLSASNRFFLTIGPQLGRTPALIPGFVTGPPGYSGLQDPPIQKHYNIGLGIAFTYKLK